MIIQVKNHQSRRIRKDLVHQWVAAATEQGGPAAYATPSTQPYVPACPITYCCPRCGAAANEVVTNQSPTFVRLNGSPIVFPPLQRESLHGLNRREIHQCMRCNLVIAESHFIPPGPVRRPDDVVLRVHLIHVED